MVSFCWSGRAHRDLDDGRRTGDDRPAPLGPKQRGGRPATAFLARDAKPKAAEKSWRRTLQVQDRGDAFVAGLRSDQTNRGRPWERLEKDSQRKPRSGDGDRRHTFSLRAAHGYLGSIKNGPEPQRQDDDVLNVAVIDDNRKVRAIRPSLASPSCSARQENANKGNGALPAQAAATRSRPRSTPWSSAKVRV